MSERKQIDFMAVHKLLALVSVVVVLGSIASLSVRQLAFGLDFTGGTLIEVAYESPVELKGIRDTLNAKGYEDAKVQHYGKSTDVLVRLPPQEGSDKDKLGNLVLNDLKAASDTVVTLKRIEFVGPQVGAELRDQSGMAMLFALGCMLLYVTFRFKFKFAVGAVVALFHDVLITLGFFSVLGLQFDLNVLAALLAVIGYSLNDTIVVSDRIRENFRKLRIDDAKEIINISLNQTLSRTLVTSLTTLLVLCALMTLGGEQIFGFAVALTVGVLVGTYSSIYVSSNVLLAMKICREDFFEITVEELDDRP